MTQSTQGIIIALLMSLLIGVIIGFYLRQSRINDLSNALKQQQKRAEDIEKEHQNRLQEATVQLQRDYENQLADKIELYQAQYNEQLNQLESEYEARLGMAGPGGSAGYVGSALRGPEPGMGDYPDAVAIEQRIRKQYETRLKEAAEKIQQAYEQHLKVKLSESREALQKDYEQRLAEKIEHYQDQLEEKLAQASALSPMTLGLMADSYSEGFPGEGVVPNAGISASPPPSALDAQLRAEYEQKLAEKIEHYQDDMAKRIEELEQEYEARFRMVQAAQPAAEEFIDPAQEQAQRAELEEHLRLELEARYKQNYDQRLAEAIERYQDEMVQRTQELEQEYEARLQLMHQQVDQATAPVYPSPSAPLPEAPVPADEPLVMDVPSDLPPEVPGQSDEDMIFSGFGAADSTIENALFSDTAPGADLTDELALDLDQPGPSQPASAALQADLTDELAFDLDPLDPSQPDPADEMAMDLDLAPPPPTPAEPVKSSELDLDELLTRGQGENFPADQIPLDDGGFDLENLEALLQAQEDGDNPDSLFDNLDDLSNLS